MVGLHEAAVADHVGGQNRAKPPLRGRAVFEELRPLSTRPGLREHLT